MTDTALAIAVPLIAEYEGFRSRPYQDVAGVWTIGYGTVYLPDQTRVTADTPPCTQEQAMAWLSKIASKTMASIYAMAHVKLNDHQAAALTSFAYNEGTNAVRTSTLMADVNKGNFGHAANQFTVWVMAGGHYCVPLLGRRQHERAVFLTPDDAVRPAFDGVSTADAAKAPPEPAPAPSSQEVLETADDLNAEELAKVAQ